METRIESYEKEVGELKSEIREHKLKMENQQSQIDNANALIVNQTKEMEDLRTNPPEITQEQIDERVQEALTQHQLENFWQRKLDETQNQLVFKNLKKTLPQLNSTQGKSS